ncbi:ribosomal-processing cysteine protease Prp [Faecalibacterium sp. AF10-46]|uniref:ribosomal-processing cysteine protease Prp n=1 Tax=Faecalibacterium sp. AF10-46 TaxID=2302955 RepID=UPI000E712976|nr:ribosomal-processing cysteine protease Prp [Faecalibacterium sp. AF10-46]RJW78349.1 ribosomal-processing cysteine protease Prp [Faecalibacterium sp. AF10-46]
MMRVCYSEMDTPAGLSCRMEAAGHAGYAPAGQDIVCAGASTVMQGLVYLLAGEENAHSEAFDEPDGPRLAVSVDAPCEEWVRGAFELAKACFVLLAERYPENVRFADVSRRGKESMMDLQLFAEGEAAPPALSEAQTRQAVASGTMKPDEAKVPAAPQASAEKTVELQPEKPRQELPVQRSELPPLSSFARSTQAAVHSLHARWAAEEAAMRRSQPDFDLQNELRSPEMRRLMQLPGMRVRDAYRLAHYDENLRTAAQAVEQGVVERIQQRAARPTENGIRPGGAATVRPDVASMTRAQREALERRVLHGAQIEL